MTSRLRFLPALLAAMMLTTTACDVQIGSPSAGPAPTDGGTTTTLALGRPDPSPDPGPGDGTVPGEGTVPGGPPAAQDPAIDATLRAFTTWAPPVATASDARNLTPKSYQRDGYQYACAPESRDLPETDFKDFAAFAFDGELVPGLLVEGRGVLDGDLRAVPVPRAPLSLQMNLASASPVIEVANPTSSGLTNALAQLKSGADDLAPFQVDYVVEETSSYEETLFHLGVSARYESPALRGKFEGEFNQSETEVRRSVVMRLVQPMYTVRVDQSEVRSPGGFLSTAADPAHLDALVADGKIGTDNVPVLIDSVTYGRAVFVTITTSAVDSATDLKAAVEGAYGGFSGSAETAARHRAILEQSTVRVKGIGGNQVDSFKAIDEGGFKGFLSSVTTSNAVPLTFSMRTMAGDLISVRDKITIQDLGCTRTEIPEERTQWKLLAYTGPAWIDVYVNSTYVTRIERLSSTRSVDLTRYMNEGRTNEVKVEVWPDTCLANPEVAIWLEGDGVVHQRRVQNSIACSWWSTWTVNDANDTVIGPSNWS